MYAAILFIGSGPGALVLEVKSFWLTTEHPKPLLLVVPRVTTSSDSCFVTHVMPIHTNCI